MRIEYVAFDGERFETKEECLQYESKGGFLTGWTTREDSLTNYEVFLEDLEPVLYRPGSPKDIIYDCTIVYVGNDESLKVAKSIDSSLEKGFNFWDGIEYVPAKTLLESYRQAMANMESLIKVLEKEIGVEEQKEVGDVFFQGFCEGLDDYLKSKYSKS